MRKDILPPDSAINHWVDAMEITETPYSYLIATAMSAIGALLRRNVYVDQVKWKVFPNLSTLLVGPSGIGKDTAINAAGQIINRFERGLRIGGKTMEQVHERMLRLGTPACAFLAAPELTAFLGGKDYQKSMVQELTDLLSTGESLDISLKSDPRPRIINEPTITMQAGSTMKWLHKAMPEGSLEGGFFPRFLIICEDQARSYVPLVKYSLGREAVEASVEADARWWDAARMVLAFFMDRKTEMFLLGEAIDIYTNWYYNRVSIFSPLVVDYAARSRDQMLRLAMLSAVTRCREMIDAQDMRFAESMLAYVATKIDEVAVGANREGEVAATIERMLPMRWEELMRTLSIRFTRQQISEAGRLLVESGRARPNNGVWELNKRES